MARIFPAVMAALLMSCSVAALAEPIAVSDDEGYSRLVRWESHLDDQIGSSLNDGYINARRAWAIQKELDSVEIHALKAYYDSDQGIDPPTYRRFADQLRHIGAELGDRGWQDEGFDNRDYGGGDNRDSGNGYYQEGRYENTCRNDNGHVAGTIFGAIAGGLIGNAASHGNGGAVVGGLILGGLLGNALTKDIDCDDQRYAFQTYDEGLNGDLDRDYEWRHGDHYGTFRARREYYDRGMVCREFHVVNYRDGQRYERDGRACRQTDGYWHFD